jgi:transposase
MSKAIFKPTNQNQPALFPFNFDGLIDSNHPVRLIDKVIEKLDITSIVSTYKGGGTSSYHPRMLLKVLIFGYLNNLFSSRKIANALKENVYFMWLSGQSFPDFRTINNFRGKRLKNDIENIFKQVVLLLVESDILTLNEVFTDGTKIESVANRYTFVWKKSVEKNKQKLEKNIQAILKEIEEAIREDNNVKEETHPSPSLTSSELNEKIQKINQKLRDKQVEKTIKKKVEKLRTEALPKLQEYESHLQKMGERNSYSKTDRDATFMRLKEDHMRNGQLKPAYNLQLSTEKNFITNFSLHWRPGDTGTFIPHLQSFKEKFGQYPNVAVADAGFGSCENYEFLDNNEIESYVKYNYFHKEQSKKFKVDISRVENLYYDAEKDYYICPMGQKMLPVGNAWKESDLDYKYEVTIYKARNCNGCPLRGACHKQKGNRQIEVNKKLNIYKQKTRENLMSDTGKKLRGRRCSEVEQTFGQIKWNKGFKRFLLRGTSKVTVEVGLIALAHNLQKLSLLLIKNDLNGKVLLEILTLKPLLWQFILIFKKHIQLKHKFEQKNIIPELYSEIKKAA